MTPHALAQRRHVLFTMLTTLGSHYPPGRVPPVIAGIRRYLDGWPGVGRIEAGMARQGLDLDLTRYETQGWRATFYPEGRIHSATLAVGSAWTREPWTAVQRAAWEALRRGEGEAA
jgi:hypothetical protein